MKTIKAIKRIILGLLFLFVLVIGVGGYFLFTTDFNKFKPQITEIVRENTGRELVINGEIKPSISLFPTLEVSDVNFSNASWSKNPEMVKVGRFKIEIAIMPILKKAFEIKNLRVEDVIIDNIEIDNAEVVLEKNADGKANWEFDIPKTTSKEETKTADNSSPKIPDFERIAIKNLKVIFIDKDEKQTFDAKSFILSKNFGGDNDIILSGSYNEQNIKLNTEISSIKSIVEDGKIEIDDLVLKLEKIGILKAEGDIEEIYSGKPDIDLEFEMDADENYTKPYKLSAKLDNKNSLYTLKDVIFKAGSSNAKGSVVIDISKEIPFVTASLKSDYLTLNDIIKDEEVKEGEEKTVAVKKTSKGGKVFSSEPLPFEVLKKINGKFDIAITEFPFKQQTFSNIKINATLNNGEMTISPFYLNIDEGILEGSVFVNAKKSPSLIKFNSTNKNINLGNLLEKLEVEADLKGGVLNSKIELQSVGSSVASIMKNLYGNITLFFENGSYVVEKKLSKTLQTFVKVLMGDSQKGVVKMNCSIAKFDVKRGVAEAKTFVLDTDGAFVTGKGNVDLGNEKLDLVLEPTAKKLGLADLISAMKLGGTLSSPSFYPDPMAIGKNVAKVGVGIFTGVGIVGLLGVEVAEELGFGDDNPCADILKKQATQKEKNNSKNQEKITDKIGNKTKSIGNKVKGFFDF